jgi:hypothetical protein
VHVSKQFDRKTPFNKSIDVRLNDALYFVVQQNKRNKLKGNSIKKPTKERTNFTFFCVRDRKEVGNCESQTKSESCLARMMSVLCTLTTTNRSTRKVIVFKDKVEVDRGRSDKRKMTFVGRKTNRPKF